MGPQRLLILALILTLGGCATMGAGVNSLKPTCTALIGPLKYNTYVLTSRRHAGPDLAADLKRRNQVGKFLGCPAYR